MACKKSGRAPAKAPNKIIHKLSGKKNNDINTDAINPKQKSILPLEMSFRKFNPKFNFIPKGRELSWLLDSIL